MVLPHCVQNCIDLLNKAGYACYAVGGCVRDTLLGLTPHDYDLCTNATPEQMRRVFGDFSLVLAGESHGTVGVVTADGVVEITTFRSEGNYTDCRHPGWVAFVDDIRQDLARRDFTVNAMAWSAQEGLVDPFGGQADLKAGILRAVGEPERRFREDALRILRGVRFSVRYHLRWEPKTAEAMVSCAPLMAHLAKERVFDELCKLLPLVTAEDLLNCRPILVQVIPELAPTVGFDQKNPHHNFDLFTHIGHVTAAVPPELSLRWAALLHDVGKIPTFTLDKQGIGHFYGHAQEGARMADEILRRLKAPNQLRQQVVFLIDKHMLPLEPDRMLLRRRLSQYGYDPLVQLIKLQKADFFSKGVVSDTPHFDEMQELLEQLAAENSCLSLRNLAVNGRDMMALGLEGPQIGQMLNRLLNEVVSETLENQRQALLSAAQAYTNSGEIREGDHV